MNITKKACGKAYCVYFVKSEGEPLNAEYLSEREVESKEYFMILWGGLILDGVADVDERKLCSLRP